MFNFLACLFFAVLFVALVVFVGVDVRDPKFKLESIAISLQDDVVDDATANWDITVSVKNLNAMSYLYFRDFNVWVRCMSESSSQAVIPPFKLGHGDTFVVNATVKTSLSAHARSQLVHGTVVDVILKGGCKHRNLGQRRMDVGCKDVGVGFLSGATQGGMRESKDCALVDENSVLMIYPYDV